MISEMIKEITKTGYEICITSTYDGLIQIDIWDGDQLIDYRLDEHLDTAILEVYKYMNQNNLLWKAEDYD